MQIIDFNKISFSIWLSLNKRRTFCEPYYERIHARNNNGVSWRAAMSTSLNADGSNAWDSRKYGAFTASAWDILMSLHHYWGPWAEIKKHPNNDVFSRQICKCGAVSFHPRELIHCSAEEGSWAGEGRERERESERGREREHQRTSCEVLKISISFKGAFCSNNMAGRVILLTNQQISLLFAPLWLDPSGTCPSEPRPAAFTSCP